MAVIHSLWGHDVINEARALLLLLLAVLACSACIMVAYGVVLLIARQVRAKRLQRRRLAYIRAWTDEVFPRVNWDVPLRRASTDEPPHEPPA